MASFIPRVGRGGKRVWQAHVRRRGHRVQVRTFDRKSDAEAWAHEIEGEMRRGTHIDRSESEATALADLLDLYAKEVTQTKRGAAQEASRCN